MKRFIDTLKHIYSIEELRNKILITLGFIAVYRLGSYEEALDIGLEDILAAEESWCFIEWPEVIEFLLPKPYQIIKLNVSPADEHFIEMKLIK